MRKLAVLLAALAASWPNATAFAVEEARFLLQSAGDLAALCSPSADDPRAAEAIHMCHGYLVGVHHFHHATTLPETSTALYCLSDGAPPTRQEAAAAFAAWIEQTSSAAELPAVEGVVRWAATRFPCD